MFHEKDSLFYYVILIIFSRPLKIEFPLSNGSVQSSHSVLDINNFQSREACCKKRSAAFNRGVLLEKDLHSCSLSVQRFFWIERAFVCECCLLRFRTIFWMFNDIKTSLELI